MIKDCIFNLDNTPEDLKEIIRNSPIYCRDGVSCNYINGKYVNITGISDFNTQKWYESLSLVRILTRIKPENFFEIALCFKLYNDFLFNLHRLIKTGIEEDVLKNVLSNKFNHNDKYKEIISLLPDSRGWLVWRYQLFNILSLAVFSSEKINFYIKGLNAKKPEIIEELQNLKINDFCVYEIISELSLPTSFMTFPDPNLRDSLIINNELKLF